MKYVSESGNDRVNIQDRADNDLLVRSKVTESKFECSEKFKT